MPCEIDKKYSAMNKEQKRKITDRVNADLEWLLSQYKVVDLPNYGDAHIIDFGSKEKEVLIFAPVLSPFDVIHVPNIRYFQNKFRIVIYRRKESKTAPISPTERAEEIHIIMNYLDIKEAHFCGLNEGAIAVFNFAKLFPNRVKSIVCTSIGIENVLSKLQIKLSKHFPINPSAWFIGQMVKLLSIPNASDNFLVAYLWSLTENAKSVLINGVIPIYENYNLHIPSLTMPLLNIQSSPVVSDNSAEIFIHSLPNGEIKYIPGNSHLCMYVYPEIFNLFMDAFYRKNNFYKL